MASFPDDLNLGGAVTVFAPGGANAGLILPASRWDQELPDGNSVRIPADWHPEIYSGDARHFWVAEGRNNSKCLRIDAEQGSDASWNTRVKVKPNTAYRLTGWVRTEELFSVEGNAFGALFNLHGRDQVISTTARGTQDWTQLVLEFESESDEEHLSINCLFGGWGQCRGSAWFDDLELIELREDGTSSANQFANASFEESSVSARPRSWRLYLDGAESDEWDFMDGLSFSQDGLHHSYRVGKRTGPDRQIWHVVHDGKAGKPYDWVSIPTLRPDGKEASYWAAKGVTHHGRQETFGGSGLPLSTIQPSRNGGEYFVVKGYKKGKEYNPGYRPFPPVYREDGRYLAYYGDTPNGWMIIIGSKEYGPYQRASPPQWSTAGKQVAWAGVPQNGEGLIFAGKKEFGEGLMALGRPVIDAKGKNAAWPTRRDSQVVVMKNGNVVSGAFNRLGKITLSADGEVVAFIGREGEGELPEYEDEITQILDDGQIENDHTFWIGTWGKWKLVVQGRTVGEAWDYLGKPVISIDAKYVAVEARRGQDWHLLLAKVGVSDHLIWKSDKYDAVGAPLFMENQVSFGARRGLEILKIEHPLLGN